MMLQPKHNCSVDILLLVSITSCSEFKNKTFAKAFQTLFTTLCSQNILSLHSSFFHATYLTFTIKSKWRSTYDKGNAKPFHLMTNNTHSVVLWNLVSKTCSDPSKTVLLTDPQAEPQNSLRDCCYGDASSRVSNIHKNTMQIHGKKTPLSFK